MNTKFLLIDFTKLSFFNTYCGYNIYQFIRVKPYCSILHSGVCVCVHVCV